MKPADATVAFVLPIGLTLGGSNIWSLRTAAHLVAAGRKAAIIEHTCVDWHPRFDMQVSAGVRHMVCGGPTPVGAQEKDSETFASVYRQVLPALFVPNYTAAAYAACARLSMERPDDVRVIGIGHGDSEAFYSLLSYYEPIIHQFIAVNRRMADHLRQIMPWRSHDIVTRSCPVDVPELPGRQFSAPSGPLQLVYAGRITNHAKRVSNLAPLMKALDELAVNFRLRVIGEGGYKQQLLRDVAGLGPGLRNRVSVEAQLAPDSMSSVWAAADISLLVSDSESTGLSLLEGMAMGCVPIATRCNGPEEFVCHGKNGFLVEIDDMDGMARCIQRLDADRVLLRNLGNAAHETARSSYSYHQYTPWFLDVTARAWAMPPRPWDSAKPIMMPEERGGRVRSLCQKWATWFRSIRLGVHDES